MGVNAMIERAVRRSLLKGGPARRLQEGRIEAERILSDARGLDGRLDRAECARREAEDARDRAIFELERLFHFIPALMLFKSLDGKLVRVNEYTARGFGLTPSEMVGRDQEDFWPPDQVERFRADDEDVVRTGKGKYGYLEDVLWEGKSYTFRTWKIPIYNGGSVPIGIMLFAINVSLVGDLSIELLGGE